MRQSEQEQKRKQTAEMIWLHYFNESLFEAGLIDERMRNKMSLQIAEQERRGILREDKKKKCFNTHLETIK